MALRNLSTTLDVHHGYLTGRNRMSGSARRSNTGRLNAYYRCNGTCQSEKVARTCSAPAIPAIDLGRAVWDHVCAAVRDPSALIADLRKNRETGSGNLGRRIARLEREIQKARNEQAAVVRQHARGVIDEITQYQMLAPIAALLNAREAELAKLVKQRDLQNASAETDPASVNASPAMRSGSIRLTLMADELYCRGFRSAS